MGHHLTADGQFQSDRHPDLPPNKIVLSFKDPHAHLGLWTVAIEYQQDDPELSGDMMTALDALGAVPPRAVVEDAWAWALARKEGVDPRATARAFGGVRADGEAEVHVVSADIEAIAALRGAVGAPSVHVYEHLVRAQKGGPPARLLDQRALLADALRHTLVRAGVLRADATPTGPELLAAAEHYCAAQPSDRVVALATAADGDSELPTLQLTAEDVQALRARWAGAAPDDGRPDFAGFLAALRGEKQWSATLHANDDTGQAATDQRRLHELAEHVERVGKRLGFLPAGLSLAAMQENDAPLLAEDDRWGSCP